MTQIKTVGNTFSDDANDFNHTKLFFLFTIS
jgi:hypothetical protein